MRYDPDIHHRHSIRLQKYDYAAVGAYSVTICTQGRECIFGDITNGEMHHNDAGRMVREWWLKLPDKFPGVMLDEYVIMPNHFHGIIVMSGRGEPCVRPPLGVALGFAEPCVRPDPIAIEKPGDHKDRPYGTRDNSLGRIVQAFKSLTTVEYTRGVQTFHWPSFPGRLWQRNFYERVIRDEAELAAIREYIQANPATWADDEERPESV
ncbi:transposase [Geotalea toluenoxydans]|uniref:transposase n=1 Tax=Geotalea toluenoxydans TaxID=421624 RepID=UPI0006CFBC03|nr:transposase [Geotalea toluenoxydans]